MFPCVRINDDDGDDDDDDELIITGVWGQPVLVCGAL